MATLATSVRQHWPEYLMEAAELGAFMVSACTFTVLLFHPASPAVAFVPEPAVRRVLVGVAMGLTAIAIVYSPIGKRSGAHLNPSVTLTFYRLGKVAPGDALLYVAAQLIGGVAGVLVSAVLLRGLLRHAAVNYAVTVPGQAGPAVAFVAELAISFLMMAMILVVSNTPRLARLTGFFAGVLVATWISVESPLSGTSMNPARTLGSALPAGVYTGIWIYLTAPVAGMLLAAETYLRVRGARAVRCAKLHHDNPSRCIFCTYQEARHG